MDSKNDLLKTSWSTLLTSFFVIALLALAGRANAAVDIEPTVPHAPIALVTR